MSRKRDKPYPSTHLPTSVVKRRRPPPPAEDDDMDKPLSKPAPPPALVVVDLPSHCSVLDLKSRFEIYGSISRIRIDRDCVGYITYRTKDSADAAMAAALDPSFGFTIDSKKVKVLWANDSQVQWRQGINVGVNKNKELSSKLLRAEVPLSRHGRGNKLASTIVNPRKTDSSSRLQLMEDDGEQEIWSWGAGTDGQLGTGRLEDETVPQLLRTPSLSSATAISSLSCGGAHVIALTAGGGVLTWGRGNSGQLGLGDMANSLHPKPVMGLESYFITHVSAGWSHSGFVSDEGKLYTCGDGSFGQLGHGDFQSRCFPDEVLFFSDKHVDQIACGMRHSLALVKGCSGVQVYGFGAGKRGQLGISKKIQSTNLPILSSELVVAEIVGIAAGGDHSAALSSDGRLFTWGRGFKSNSDAYSPLLLPSPLLFSKVVLGWNHALVLTDDGKLYMLGGKHHGTLSDSEKLNAMKSLPGDSEEDNLRAVPALSGIKILDIAAGAEHSAIVTEDGAVKTWGWGEHGQLGLGDTCDHTNPQTVNLSPKLKGAAFDIKVYCGSGFTVAITTPHVTANLSN